MDKNKLWLKYLAYSVSGLLIVVSLLAWKEVLDAESTKETLKILADSFTLPGIFFVGFAGLAWVSSKGGYDMFGYAWNSFRSFFVRDAYFKKQESYFDYVQRKNSERKPFNKVLLFVGLGLLIVGVAFTVAYYLI